MSRILIKEKSSNGHGPPKLIWVWEYLKGMTINITILVSWLIIWLILTTCEHLLWHACSMLSTPIYFWCICTDHLYFLVQLLIHAYVPIAQTVLSLLVAWLLPPQITISVLIYDRIFLSHLHFYDPHVKSAGHANQSLLPIISYHQIWNLWS